ncbi:MAG: DUF6913 domain-containing protein [Luteibaculaceae bacterium]
MLHFLGKYLVKRTIAKGFTRERKIQWISFNEATTIALLYNYTDQNSKDLAESFLKKLGSDFGFKKLVAIGYKANVKRKEPELNQTDRHKIFTANQVDWKFNLTAESAKELAQYPFDIILDFNLASDLVLQNYVLQFSPKMLVGIAGCEQSKFCDFLVQPKDKKSLSSAFAQMVHYLSKEKQTF